MICYQCGHKIKENFANFCDHCGYDLNEKIKPKSLNQAHQKETINLNDEMDRVTNLFLLWNFNIAASFFFYVIHMKTNDYGYLFLIILFMLIVTWILLIFKFHDIAILKRSSIKNLIFINLAIPLIGTFYYFVKINQVK
jgi:ribosomal protein L37E